jgi:hypothetical protein
MRKINEIGRTWVRSPPRGNLFLKIKNSQSMQEENTFSTKIKATSFLHT